MLQRIQYLSEKGEGLQSCLSQATSPVFEARRALSDMARQPLHEGPLATLFWYVGAGSDTCNQVRLLSVAMGGQLWWRFLSYETWPVKLAVLANPSMPNRHEVAKELSESSACCLGADFALKTRPLFGSAEEMSGDRDFQGMLAAWVRTCKLDNMHIERLFAGIKCAWAEPKGRAPLAERVCSAGLLTQLQQARFHVTGKRFGSVTHQSLLQERVPLARKRWRAEDDEKRQRRWSGFLVFRSELNKARKRAGRPAGAQWERHVGGQWRALSPSDKQAYHVVVRASVAPTQRPRPGPLAKARLKPGSVHGFSFGVADATSPLATQTLSAAVEREVGACNNGTLGGFARYSNEMRRRFSSRLCVSDQGAHERCFTVMGMGLCVAFVVPLRTWPFQETV